MKQQLETAELRGVLDELTPLLDEALTRGPLNAHEFMGPYYDLPRDMKRRGGICNATSWLLSAMLKKHNISTMPTAKRETIQIGDTHYMTQHVMLKMQGDDTRYIDPTAQQFYRYVGLTSERAAQDATIAELYPENTITIIDSSSNDYHDSFAARAHQVERSLGRLGVNDGILAGTTLDEKVATYRQVWDVATYKPMFSPRLELRNAVAYSAKLLDLYALR